MMLAFTIRPAAALCSAMRAKEAPCCSLQAPTRIRSWGAFWTILMIFLWVIWFWVLITIFIDLFRSHDLSGWARALWFIFIFIFPLIGVLVYLIARGGKMHRARGAGRATSGAADPSVCPGGRRLAEFGGPAGQAC